MSLKKLLADRKLTADQIGLPCAGVAVFGRTGNGKSSMFFGSELVNKVIVTDPGSMVHRLWAGDRMTMVTATDVNGVPIGKRSPVEVVGAMVRENSSAGQITLLDSWSTLQELQIVWYKTVNGIRGAMKFPQHNDVISMLRDLALTLATSWTFTIFNTTSGGQGKTPEGQVINYPPGAITGYPSLNGTEANKETILARWGTVLGVFKGWPEKEIPRGLYVPARDIRPEGHDKYAPLKDPYGVIRDTSGKGIMEFPDLSTRTSDSVSFVDSILVDIAAKYPTKRVK